MALNPWLELGSLAGKFFHDFDEEGYVQHQGRILAVLNDDIAVIQYFDWVMGAENTTHLAWVRDIVDGKWPLYVSDEEMREAVEIGHVRSRRS